MSKAALLFGRQSPVVQGTLWTWGYNRHGELGLGVASEPGGPYYATSSPTQVGALTTWSTLASNWLCNFHQTTDGKLFVWGFNFHGPLGINDGNNPRSSPVQLGALTTWHNMSGGSVNSGSGMIGGKAYSWGNNYWRTGATQLVYSPLQVGSATDWTDFCSQAHFVHGIRSNGKMYGWGENDWGQLGIGSINYGPGSNDPTYLSPVAESSGATNWLKLVRGRNLTCFALKNDRTLWATGQNSHGEHGILTHTSKIGSFTQVLGGHTWSDNIAVGEYSVAAIDTGGHLWVWGDNQYGELGLGDNVSRSSPVQLGTNTWSSVAAGQRFVLGVRTNGTMWSWGKSRYGRLLWQHLFARKCVKSNSLLRP